MSARQGCRRGEGRRRELSAVWPHYSVPPPRGIDTGPASHHIAYSNTHNFTNSQTFPFRLCIDFLLSLSFPECSLIPLVRIKIETEWKVGRGTIFGEDVDENIPAGKVPSSFRQRGESILLNNIKIQFVPHRKHIASPLGRQSLFTVRPVDNPQMTR
jgi:hypothetical protein